MKRALFKQVILTSIIVLLSSQSVFSKQEKKYTAYTGIYASVKNENIKMIFLEDNGSLYVQGLSSIFPIIFTSKTDFKVPVWGEKSGEFSGPSHDRFSELKNGKHDQKMDSTRVGSMHVCDFFRVYCKKNDKLSIGSL